MICGGVRKKCVELERENMLLPTKKEEKRKENATPLVKYPRLRGFEI